MIKKLIDQYKKLSLPAKASLWFMFTSVVNRGVSFITTPFFTRLLTQEEYGIVSLYNTWFQIVTIFATFELATGVFNKAMIKYEDDRDGYTSSSMFLTTFLTGFVFLVYLIGRNLWNEFLGLNTFVMVAMFIDIFFSTAWSFYTIRNRFEFKYRTIVIVTILTNVFASALSLALVIMIPGARVEAKVAGTVVIRALVYSVVYVKMLAKGKRFFVPKYWKYSILYNLPLIPHYLSQQVLNQSDRIMISKMCGNADAGVYSLAYQLAAVMQIVTNAIHASFMPWCFQTIKSGENIKNIGKRALQIEIMIGVVCLGFSLFAPELVLVLGGSSYARAIYIVPPVSMSILFLTMYSFFGNIEFYYERTSFIMVASVTIAVLNVILNAIFINIYGFVAAGYTTLVCYIGYSIVHYLFMKHICRDENLENPFYGVKMWSIAAIMAVLSVGVSFVYPYMILRYVLIVVIAVFSALYFVKNKNVLLGK